MLLHRRMQPKLSETFRTQGGHKFQAQLGSPNGYPRPRKEIQNLPHRALVTSRNSLAEAGDLVTHAGQSYLLCGQHVMSEVKRFLAVEVNHMARWTRTTRLIDPVTRMERDEEEIVVQEALPVALEPSRALQEQNFQVSQYRLLTAADVALGEYIDGMKVIGKWDLMGLNMVEVA